MVELTLQFSPCLCDWFISQGLISVAGDGRRLVVQAVHELYDSFFTSEWEDEGDRINRLVFIGSKPKRHSCLIYKVVLV